MAISDWPEHERPREKLLLKGANALSDAELLAIFLRTGSKGKSAIELARELLQRFGSLRQLMAASQVEFCEAHGLGTAKFTQLKAVTEMSRRYLEEQLSERPIFSSSQSVKNFLVAQLRDEPREYFSALFLNARHQLICFERLSTGTIDGATVYPREVVERTLKHRASTLILAHNHPSGNPDHSQADIDITHRLSKALDLIDVTLLDHFIVAGNTLVSLAERGLLTARQI